MKNKNKRELERHWATEAAKKRKAAKKRGTTHRDDENQAAARMSEKQRMRSRAVSF
jgi:hypothetical protein